MREDKPPLIAALENPEAYPDTAGPVRLVETHISWVFLTGEHAYKVKKPIKLPFLDFSTLALRRHFCEEELELNRRLAPQIYEGVVPIGGTPQQPKIGATPAIEYAVKMRQFPDDARLDRQVRDAAFPAEALLDFAARLARFHRELPELPNEQPPEQEAAAVVEAVVENLNDLRERLGASASRSPLASIEDWTRRQIATVAPAIAARLAGRAQKECHGDLHLENLVILDGEIVAFDALEFDPALREIDVISEASFLAMDLLAHRRPDLAFRFLTRYLETGGDYSGLAVLRFYLVYRAMIRAKVRAIKAEQAGRPEARARELEPYFDVARALLEAGRPLLVINHGFSGSGKTHVTEELIGLLPALRVRSDLERKREHDLAPNAASNSAVGGGIYTQRASARTYERLLEIANGALRNGFSMIVDATFLKRAERDAFRKLSAERGARFAILDVVAEPATLRRRIAARSQAGPQASEATAAVLDRQLAHHDPLTPEERASTVTVDTENRLDYDALAAALCGLKPPGVSPK